MVVAVPMFEVELNDGMMGGGVAAPAIVPAIFQPFVYGEVYQQKDDIDIIMDVPMEITVELGHTHRKFCEVLEFEPGTVFELNKLAGEPADIFTSGTFVAKGEVVIMDENFGIRITEIVAVEKRI